MTRIVIDKQALLCTVLYTLLAIFVAFVSSCAKVDAKVPILMPDKTIEFIELGYSRVWNQKIGDFYLETPNGWIISFNKQEADNSSSFKVGPYEVTTGGGPK